MDEIKNYLPQTIAWTKQHTNIGQDIFGNQRYRICSLSVVHSKSLQV